MLKDLVRVGPPQGTIKDLDLGVPKEFDKDFHKDFEKELKLAKEEKAEKQEKPNRDLEQVSKKSSGGIKKKMARAKDDESDADKPEKDARAEAKVQPQAIEEKISKVMVSDEGEVEIADSDENLQQIATEQANIQNMQAQLLAAQLAVTGEAAPSGEQQQIAAEQTPIAVQGEAVQQQSFQYLTNTEKALLADIDGEQALATPDMAMANSEVPVETTELQLQNAATAKAANTQMSEQDVQAKEEKQPTALESKVFDILSKENAKPGLDQKLVQQEVSPKAEQTQALNQTNAVLAKSAAENEQRQGESQHKNSGGSESQSQSLPKFDASNDLAAQVQALHAGQRSSFQSHLGAAAGAGAVANKPEAGADAMKDENIREIMNQAKYLVTKGGGEMTVRMTPEGMGEVQLKVALENGKINIEMNSQDKSVKKMIEESLSDLKSSLASHQMRVEHVKINNVTAVDTNNQSQFQSDANSSNSSFQNRQQQEMNFQNMANSNSGRGGHQQERGSSSYQTVQAPTVKPVAKANAYVAANKGSSINMVA